MPAPHFKIDGRPGATLRYFAHDGRKRFSTGRRSHVYGFVYVNALLTGQARDGIYEMRLSQNGPWHRLRLTPAEAIVILERDPLARGRLARLRRRPDFVG